MQRFEKAVARADTMLADTVHSGGTLSTLSSLINVFDDQILEVARNALEDMRSDAAADASGTQADGNDSILPNPLIVTTARVHVNAYHFFGQDPAVKLPALVELFSMIRQFTDQAARMDSISDWALYTSESYFRHFVLMMAMILRMSRSHPLKLWIDLKQAERTYFALVKLLKRRSLQDGDINASLAKVFSQLWHSESDSQGQDSLQVEACGRGVRFLSSGRVLILYAC